MQPNMQPQPQPLHSTGAAPASVASDGGQTVAAKVSDTAHEQVKERSAEVIDQAKQKVSEAYDQAHKHVTEQYEKAIDYGRENPGKTTLLVFGLGVGVGMLLMSSLSTLRSRVVS